MWFWKSVCTESATAITEQFPVKTCFRSVEKACCGQNMHKLCKLMCKSTISVEFKFQFLMFKLCKMPIFVLLSEAIIEILLKNHYFCAPVGTISISVNPLSLLLAFPQFISDSLTARSLELLDQF